MFEESALTLLCLCLNGWSRFIQNFNYMIDKFEYQTF